VRLSEEVSVGRPVPVLPPVGGARFALKTSPP
jgi:hypothetical protein